MPSKSNDLRGLVGVNTASSSTHSQRDASPKAQKQRSTTTRVQSAGVGPTVNIPETEAITGLTGHTLLVSPPRHRTLHPPPSNQSSRRSSRPATHPSGMGRMVRSPLDATRVSSACLARTYHILGPCSTVVHSALFTTMLTHGSTHRVPTQF